MEDFKNKGYIILKNAISLNLIKKIQLEIIKTFSKNELENKIRKSNFTDNYKKFTEIIQSLDKNTNYYDLLIEPYNKIIKNKLIHKLLFSKKIYSSMTDILGKDLSFVNDPSLVLNIPKKNDPKKNYLFKDWHQEFWSGSSHMSIQMWLPIFQSSSKSGQIELIPGSHLWGHIPHSNRKPLSLPKKYKVIQTHLEYGDAIIFHTLLLHRSKNLENNSLLPRLAYPILVKNFRNQNNSFEYLRNWEIFSYSDISYIERALGNHHLSPYRVIDLELKHKFGIYKK